MTEVSSQQADDEYWMEQALVQARAAEAAGEVPVGAVLVVDGEQVAAAANAPISESDPTGHAEVRALRQACASLGNYRLPPNSTLYVTLEPCPMCAGAMVHARVSRVVFGASDPRTGAAGTVMNLIQHQSLNHQADIKGGILAAECAEMLQSFFRAKR